MLLYGPRKAGTTLVLNLVDGSDELVVYPSEVKLKLLERVYWDGDVEASRETFYRGSYILGGEYPGFSSEQYEKLARETPFDEGLRGALLADVENLYASIDDPPARPKGWVFKEVGGDPGKVLRLFRHLFHDGRVVLIVRDPRMVARAILRNRRRRGIRLSLRQTVDEVVEAFRWTAQVRRFADDPRTHVVSYERLTEGHLREEMHALAEHLDVAYTDRFEEPTIFGHPVVVKTSSRESAGVFSSDASWRDGLRPLEMAVVAAVTTATRLYYRVRHGLDTDPRGLWPPLPSD